MIKNKRLEAQSLKRQHVKGKKKNNNKKNSSVFAVV